MNTLPSSIAAKLTQSEVNEITRLMMEVVTKTFEEAYVAGKKHMYIETYAAVYRQDINDAETLLKYLANELPPIVSSVKHDPSLENAIRMMDVPTRNLFDSKPN